MSAGMAFGMVLAGARGKTASELSSAMGTGELGPTRSGSAVRGISRTRGRERM